MSGFSLSTENSQQPSIYSLLSVLNLGHGYLQQFSKLLVCERGVPCRVELQPENVLGLWISGKFIDDYFHTFLPQENTLRRIQVDTKLIEGEGLRFFVVVFCVSFIHARRIA